MLLEYFDDASLEHPVLLLYGNDPSEAGVLRSAVNELAAGTTAAVQVDCLPGDRRSPASWRDESRDARFY